MDDPKAGAMKKRSVVIAGHRTSVSLENAFWAALKELARRRGMTVNQLVTEIDSRRAGNLSSAIRVYVLHAVRGGAERTAASGRALSGKGRATGP